MALHVPMSGLSSMLKDGAQHYSGIHEAVLRNIDACKQISKITRSSYGPCGMNKMVINHLEKLFVTNDAATVIKELEVEHPAAKMLVMAMQMQDQEIGDGTNFVLLFSGALLELGEDLIRMGLSPSEVIEGYNVAMRKVLDLLPNLVCDTIKDLTDTKGNVLKALSTAVGNMQYGNSTFFAELVAKACSLVLPENPVNFNVDNVRIAKILGSGVLNSSVVNGLVFKRLVEGDVTKATNAKIAVYSCPFDASNTETKGTVLINTAEELKTFSKGEEALIESQVKAVADTGCSVVVTGGKVGEMALHFLNKYKIMTVRLLSKFDVRRVCRATGATALPKLVPPTADECGHCDYVSVEEIGDTNVVIFRQDKIESRVATIVIRGSTEGLMDDVERLMEDGVNTFKALTRDGRLLPGGGATEIELANTLMKYGETCPGMEQYAIQKFAEAFEVIPRALAENSGFKPNEIVSKLYAAHQKGDKTFGVDVESDDPNIKDVCSSGGSPVYDLFSTRYWGIKLAATTACTVLRVDQIIMAKRAGGPKQRENKNWDDDD
ncbi:PREDICTED: T-complex protein 1 subunit theta-like [Amphimedon queenslandica]|uniref:T-complex protein 1 subunit theta n=1 Tax=Amphimedon queenslandica TaxID=400682 RepID=A0A1X7VIM7_AMPQE|nr:PREDICTED: T-complex protein 1 subunit theta-like [Amphimedon queenslandica]|eukprot:XP_003384039.1 PREDICTED: T-complex protein 1 subunit theta-like [Amphimedon queenslandica]